MSLADDPAAQTMIANMPDKTGKPLEKWLEILNTANLEKHGEMIKLLKTEFGMTHGFANTISMIYREQLAGGPIAADQLLEAQYANKPTMKAWYDKLQTEISLFGSDVEFSTKKKYVSLRRAKQFGIIQPSTTARMDLGLNLRGVTAEGALITGDKWGGMCSHRIEIYNQKEITPEVISWLKKAFDLAV